MNRRSFIQTTAAAAAALASAPLTGALGAESPAWPIGCFNRAWTKWSYDDALDGIAAAGYKVTGLLSGHKGESFTSADATPEYLDDLKRRLAQRGLAAGGPARRKHSRPSETNRQRRAAWN
jgi:sugar phosphate isomerase/epimerase